MGEHSKSKMTFLCTISAIKFVSVISDQQLTNFCKLEQLWSFLCFVFVTKKMYVIFVSFMGVGWVKNVEVIFEK